MVATLAGGSNAEHIAIDFECAVATNRPLTVCVRRLDGSTHVGPFSWKVSWTHSGEEPCGIGRFVLVNASSIVLSRCWSSPGFFRHAAPWSTGSLHKRKDFVFSESPSTDSIASGYSTEPCVNSCNQSCKESPPAFAVFDNLS